MALANPLLPDPNHPDEWRSWADGQLEPMDLSVALLHHALDQGQRKRDAASPLSPKQTFGTDGWSGTVAALRSLTRWPADDSGNLSRTIHPSGRFHILVLTGDEMTGRLFGRLPSPKNGLRPTVRALIDAPADTIPWLDRTCRPINFDTVEPFDLAEELWLLMMHRTESHMYAELSRPSARDEGVIVDYHQRIQLPPLPYDLGSVRVTDDPDDDLDPNTGPEIDVRPIE